jgi:DNA-binding transcriptional LysR family regulator
LPHVAYGVGIQELGIADRALFSTHPEARIAMSVQSFFLLPFMLTNTRYITLVHERLARRLTGMGDIKVLRLQFETAPITEALYWHPRLTHDPAHKWLRDLLHETTQGMEP